MKKVSRIILSAAAAFAAIITVGAVCASAQECPSQKEIKEKYEELGLDKKIVTEYTDDYSLKKPYDAGTLSDKTLKQALNMANFIRFTAGLPEVSMDKTYNKYAQHAALVNMANGSLSHSPRKPSGMSSELYNLGYTGSSKSNLGMGYSNIPDSIVHYTMDTDESNIDRVGHRRWILNPYMKKMGFGIVGRAAASYVLDGNYSGSKVYDYVAWPPENMPYELYDYSYMGYAFSVSLCSAYSTPDINKITVEMTSEKLDKTWKLDKNSDDMYNDYLTIDTQNFGSGDCIIFNVGKFPKNDKITVKISGIYRNGKESPIEYTVNLFEMYPEPVGLSECEIEDIPNQSYSGKKKTPKLNITYGGQKLEANKDYTVEYSYNKEIGTAVARITGKGNFTGTRKVTFDIVPKKPSGFKAVKKSNSSVKLSWKAVTGADKYYIYSSVNGGKYKKIGTVSAVNTDCTIGKLDLKNNTYKFAVRSYTKGGYKDYQSSLSKASLKK